MLGEMEPTVQPQGIQENNLEENVLSNEEQPNVTAN